MKRSLIRWFVKTQWMLLLLGLSVSGFAEGEGKPIRLRNEIITPAAPDRGRATLQAQTVDKPVSGLYLVQFSERFQNDWRAPLRSLGVELVRFVPEDAFVARLENARLRQIRALPFVRWVGDYRPELRVFDGLHGHLQGQVHGSVAVCVLLAPGSVLTGLPALNPPLTGVHLESRSALGTVIRAEVTPAQLAELARSEAVLWIEPAPRMKLSDEISSKIVGGGMISLARSAERQAGGPATAVGGPVHETVTQQLGFDGRDVVVAVADTGLHTGDPETMHPDLAGRVDAFLAYGPLLNGADEHGHGTHVAGIIAGDGATGETDQAGMAYGLGIAPKARLVVQRVFDGLGRDELPAYEVLTQDAVRAGAVIGSHSWGDPAQGRYDLNAAQFDALVRDADPETPGQQPYVVQFSVGNAGPGPQTIDSPAVGKNVIATGASQNDRFSFLTYGDGQNAIADFSSRGPCEDGRIKPDLVAPGTWIASLQSPLAGDGNAWGSISGNYQYQGGSSQAGPHVAGAAAVFVQYYRETHGKATPSPALVKAALINSAVDMDNSAGTVAVPNSDEGWGRVALTNLMGSARRAAYIDQTNVLSTGQVYERRVIVATSRAPLKVTLVYTDVPGLPAALPALVNDLDLEVIGPEGATYRGNQFRQGESVEGAPGNDSVNNVEAVHLAEPAAGEYVIRVRARNVAEDILQRNDRAPQQDFALVISGDLPEPGVGTLVLDRAAYTAPGLIQIRLIDRDLVGQTSIDVSVKSSTEPGGEVTALRPNGAMGIFTGALPTATGQAVPDGRLQISHGDSIEVTYRDASPSAIRTATARADFLPPQIGELTVTNRFGKEIIIWQTDEPTTGTLFYGPTATQMLAVTNRLFSSQHQVELDNLNAGAVYQFYIVSTDAAGNTSTHDNRGQLYRFLAVPAPAVLLVNAYVPDDPTLQTTVIPLSTYTDALDQLGVSYEVWDLTQPTSRSPSSSDLRPFRIVIWRLSDSLLGTATLSAAQQSALESHVKAGGSLFIASMELLSRLGVSSPFRTNVLQVREFTADTGMPWVHGQAHDPISRGMHFPLDYSAYDNDIVQSLELSPDAADALIISSEAAPVFFDLSEELVAGLRYPRVPADHSGRVVFFPFPFDAVPETGERPNDRVSLMRGILSFLAPGIGGIGSISFDRSAYTLPDLVSLEVADSDLAGRGLITVKVFSSSMPGGVAVVLSETSRRGVFRGSVTAGSLTAAGSIPLRAEAGDDLWAEYLDDSSSNLATAQAVVDVDPPAITDLSVTPEYDQAVVRWTTGEPADALVQFGESTFLGRTAYRAEFGLEHQLTLVGLQTDRTYYFQVVSRDRAGNTQIDNNHASLYTFRTLKPMGTPWSDTLDGPGAEANWAVIEHAQDGGAWTFGIPDNGLETSAFSPPHAWGSNLAGHSIFVADTMLVSPALQVTGGNSALLRFWHSYDFSPRSDSDFFEYGQLLVSTNQGTDWLPLNQYEDASSGWQEAVVDLTPYLGRVIQLGWSYRLFTLEANPRPGWLIDSVSVVATNQPMGTVQVTNNIAQASFTLTGPVSRNGQGWSTTFTNLPFGQYVVQFNEAPFYDTPAPQTHQVADQALLTTGQYTFADENNNGISDAWELHYFGDVDPARSGAMDSDADGLSDYGEFIAGTHPLDPSSVLQFLPPMKTANGVCRLTWTTTPGHAYQLLASTDHFVWSPYSPWLRASSSQLAYSASADSSTPLFFRLQVSP